MIVKYDYDNRDSGDEHFTMTITAEPPSGKNWTGSLTAKLFSYFVSLDDYIPCTEEALGDRAPTINLGDHDGSVVIASPMYPSLYIDKSNCHWDFIASDPSKAIQLTKLDWNVCNVVKLEWKY